jgi:transcription elongation factor GreB
LFVIFIVFARSRLQIAKFKLRFALKLFSRFLNPIRNFALYYAMSKAFTREMDDVPEPPRTSFSATLPHGVKNYFTPRGWAQLQRQRQALEVAATSPGNRQRLLDLQSRLQAAVVIPPPPPPWRQVLFGATVTVRDQSGEESTYRIVGVNEMNLERDDVSWLSPLAKALLQAQLGDRVRFRSPAGEQTLEIIALRYEPVEA